MIYNYKFRYILSKFKMSNSVKKPTLYILMTIYAISSNLAIFVLSTSTNSAFLPLTTLSYIVFYFCLVWKELKNICNNFRDYFTNERTFYYLKATKVVTGLYIFLNFGNVLITRFTQDNEFLTNLSYISLMSIILTYLFIWWFCYKYSVNDNNSQVNIEPQINNNIIIIVQPNYTKENFNNLIKAEVVTDKIMCPICLEDDENESKVVKLECKHDFHEQCLYECYKNNLNKCPICRKEFLMV